MICDPTTPKTARGKVLKGIQSVTEMSDADAFEFLKQCRWIETEGAAVCPDCDRYVRTFLATRQIWKCSACGIQFSLTSRTVFGHAKVSLKTLILVAFVFAGGAKGVSSLQIGRMLGMDQKTAFFLAHKFRHAILSDVSKLQLAGEIEMDGAVFGGHLRHANVARANGKTRFTRKNTVNKRIIIVARQRDGRTVPFVGHRESDAVRDIIRVVQPGSVIHADEGRSWDKLSRLFGMMRIKHKEAFSFQGACTNNAESFFAQMRKLHNGTYHKISGEMLRAYACELAWRVDHAKLSQSERTKQLLHIALQPTDQRIRWRDRLTEQKLPTAEIIQLFPHAPRQIAAPLGASDHKRLPMFVGLEVVS